MGQQKELGKQLFLSCIAPENVYYPDDCCSVGMRGACAIRHAHSGRKYVAFKAKECYRNVRSESLEAALKRSIRTFRAPEQIVRPVDLVYLAEDGPYLVYPNRLDGDDWRPCKEYLPLYMEESDEAGGQIARTLTEMMENLHNKGLVMDGLNPEQIWVHRTTKQVRIYTGGEVFPAERRRYARDKSREDLYTDPPRVWDRAKHYPTVERDNFSVAVLRFWLQLGFHPFASTEARRWVRWADRCAQYHAGPFFCCSKHPAFQDKSRSEFGFFADERESLRRWETLSDEEKKAFCAVFEDVERQEKSRNIRG